MESTLDREGPILPDEDYAAVWRDLWEQEDDVSFSSVAALEWELHGSVPVVAVIQAGCGELCMAQPSGSGATLWWASLKVGPAFQAHYIAHHLHAAEFHERLIVSQGLIYFAPCLVWMPMGLMKEFPSF
ncbi:unnamed protein product [Calypogeia fissa]